jgi:single-stranded-DNA-specific exonuclease
VRSPAPTRSFRLEPYSYEEARALADGLGISEPTAVTLVRRGYRTVADAQRFLEADEAHDPFAFEGMPEVVATIRAAIAAGTRITVHGDYDCDGVCATALLVGRLRTLGADCDWYIPDRMAEGYGLSEATVERLAQRGTGLLVTADCGISSAAEVAAARAAGLEVVVTDHHVGDEVLPDCPILHPRLCGYPFEELCGTGVVYKLAAALLTDAGGDPADADAELDLVALATVADVVPLIGENRRFVRSGLALMRSGRRPGLRALMAAAGAVPDRLDEGDLAFRLAPRINAAGRLYRADAGVELLLTPEPERATAIAEELDRVNRERQATEREVETAAEAALRELPEELRAAPAIVLAGHGWHPGVVGIVASRLVERHWRPVCLIALDGEGRGRGSGRSIPGFDLLAGLRATEEHLLRYGGHHAAAGLEIEARAVEPFRRAFVAHAAAVLGPEQLTRTERVDALVGAPGLGLELAEELGRLAPFGMGNPGVRLLVPSATVADVRTMGEGRHVRFSLRSGGGRALGVAFGRAALPVAEDEAVDASVRLEVNNWNGSIEPRVVLGELYPLGPEAPDREPSPGHLDACGTDEREWWTRLEAECTKAAALADAPQPPPGPRRIATRGRSSTLAVLAELTSSGEQVLALCADASRRAGLARGSVGLARFAAGRAAVACGRCADAHSAELLRGADAGLVLADWVALMRNGAAPQGFTHVVIVDPPPSPSLAQLAAAGEGYLHETWGDPERDFSVRVVESELELRPHLVAIFRELRAAGGAPSPDRLAAILRGPGPYARSPELAGRCVRVLLELGLAQSSPERGAQGLRVVSSEATELERSGSYGAYRARLEEARRYLGSQKPQ